MLNPRMLTLLIVISCIILCVYGTISADPKNDQKNNTQTKKENDRSRENYTEDDWWTPTAKTAGVYRSSEIFNGNMHKICREEYQNEDPNPTDLLWNVESNKRDPAIQYAIDALGDGYDVASRDIDDGNIIATDPPITSDTRFRANVGQSDALKNNYIAPATNFTKSISFSSTESRRMDTVKGRDMYATTSGVPNAVIEPTLEVKETKRGMQTHRVSNALKSNETPFSGTLYTASRAPVTVSNITPAFSSVGAPINDLTLTQTLSDDRAAPSRPISHANANAMLHRNTELRSTSNKVQNDYLTDRAQIQQNIFPEQITRDHHFETHRSAPILKTRPDEFA